MKPTHLRSERGFTLIELMVAMVCTTIVLGGAVALTSQVQTGYRRQLEDSAGEQEARYAMEWIGRYLRGAGNNPFNVTSSNCPGANTTFYGVIMDPNGDDVNDDITLQSDSNPPDGLIGGSTGNCNQANEHVTISFDATNHTIVFLDEAVGASATTRTDNVIGGLQFVYLDSSRAVTTVQADVFYVQTQITIRTRTMNGPTGQPSTRTLTSEIRVRNR
jgi:prepilin-type N-terminal cleavage/methylation domain-containing protein